jgi:hypothetical protein
MSAISTIGQSTRLEREHADTLWGNPLRPGGAAQRKQAAALHFAPDSHCGQGAAQRLAEKNDRVCHAETRDWRGCVRCTTLD